MPANDALSAIAEYIKAKDGFTIVSHMSPDGDTLGSALALRLALLAMGKRAEVVCEDSVPHIYAFLPGASEIIKPDEARPEADVIAIDCADARRMGSALALFEAAQSTANIDHHRSNLGYAALNAVDADAAAAGELIYALVSMLTPVDRDIATCLYAALMTDTGNFAYANTRPRTLRIAADLLEAGANNNEINRRIYRSVPAGKQRLLGTALSRLELCFGGAVGISDVFLGDFAAAGAGEEDTEGIIDRIRDIESVEVAVFIRESKAGVYKVSLRSKTTADVGAVAVAFGGGGHMRAAGYTALGEHEAIRAAALSAAGKALVK